MKRFKVTPGKEDSFGNVSHWRAHNVDDWWEAQIFDTREEAEAACRFANGE